MAKRRWSPFNSTEPIRPRKVEGSSTGSSYTFPLARHSEKWWFRLIAIVMVVVLLLVGAAVLAGLRERVGGARSALATSWADWN
jgi:hypothetical protein